MESTKEKKAWATVMKGKRFLNAFRGVRIVIATTRHFMIHLFFAALSVVLGFYLHISEMEWIAIIFAIGFVIMAEAFNTAIEIDIDLTSPEYHPYARDTKDVAAGAVLVATFTAVIVGLIVFIPKIF